MCLNNEAIVVAYLFGSAVKGKMKTKSGVDVALIIREARLESFPRLSIMGSLRGHVEKTWTLCCSINSKVSATEKP